jgi:hypothetical protein
MIVGVGNKHAKHDALPQWGAYPPQELLRAAVVYLPVQDNCVFLDRRRQARSSQIQTEFNDPLHDRSV